MDAVSATIDRDDNLAVHPDVEARDAAVPSHLDHLEAESIHIIREAVAESKNPVLLYSIGKDSSVLCISCARRSIRQNRRCRCSTSIPPGNSAR
jgi:hypothetical protein